MNDKKIIFPDIDSFELKYKSNINISNFNISNNKSNINISKTSTIISNYITYLVNNNLLPELPNELKIVYVKDNSFFTLNENKNNINSVSIEQPEHYLYPACISITSNTLYLSNDLELDSNLINHSWNKLIKTFNHSKANSILNYREIFNDDNQKVLEYLIGHEFGHFFLQIKNKDKQLLSEDKIIERCALNIEESFSEAFSLHIICLKNKGIELETNYFDNLKKDRLETEKHRLRFFKNNPNEKDIIEYQDSFSNNGIDKLLNSYDFPLVYQNIPFKDRHGNLEKDINVIYKKCYQLALDNNREVIKNLLNNETFKKYGLTKIFLHEMEKSLKIIVKDNTIDEIITLTHKELEGMSFSTKKILGLRDKFINQSLNPIKPNI